MSSQRLKVDNWSYYDFKQVFANDLNVAPIGQPTWLSIEQRRRLSAYIMLQSYYQNQSRFWLKPDMPVNERENRREYGDAATIVDTILASLIGEQQTLLVPDAIPSTDPTESGQAEGGAEGGATAKTIQKQLQEWMDNERFIMKMIECERNATKLGDGVYVLANSEKKGRPRLYVYDPGFYFPVMTEEYGAEEEFPLKVHIAYEFCKKVRGEDKMFVRRITWELAVQEGQEYVPATPDDADVTCLYSDGTWAMDGIGEDPDNFEDSKAMWKMVDGDRMYRYDLDLDFIPVVHVPNCVAINEHFGTSVMAKVLQLLDDIIATDTDLQAASAITGTPAIAVSKSNTTGNQAVYGPGTLLDVGEGSATVIDTSSGLAALMGYKNDLLERLSVNARVPEALLGRIKPNEVPSGIALALGFTQHTTLIKEMRLVRWEKYGLLFKFVQRMLGVANPIVANLEFGTFLPGDKEATVTYVVQLYTAKLISLETAVQMLMESGFPINEVATEVERIMSEDYTRAQSIMTLTGNEDLARKAVKLPARTADEKAQDQEEHDATFGQQDQ